MQINDAVWKKFVKLKSEYESRNEIFSRRAVKKEFSCSEHDARLLLNISNLSPVVLQGNGYSDQAALARKNEVLKRKIRQQEAEINRLARAAEVQADIKVLNLNVPKWQGPGNGKSSAIACAMLSDTHYDEVVKPEEINYANAYNRAIATERTERYFNALVKLRRVHLSGINIDGLVLMMAGDMVSGVIHEELSATNEYAITDSLVYYAGLLTAGIEMLLEHYKKLMIPCVVGNHGRLTPKVKYKGAVQDNFDYLLYMMIAERFRSSKHAQFYIPVSPDALFPVLNTGMCLYHGQEFKGGNGWGGAVMPIMKGDARKRARYASMKQPYDVLCTAHYHTRKFLGGQVMNGSLIGPNDYSVGKDFSVEAPEQAFFLIDGGRGITFTTPIHCKAKVESWEIGREAPEMFGL